MVSVKKNTEAKNNENCQIITKNTHFFLQIFGWGDPQNFLGKPGSSWFNQEDPAFSKTVFVFYWKAFWLWVHFPLQEMNHGIKMLKVA